MPPLRHSDVSFAKLKLGYPIYAADFDPSRRGYLIVGGGGGESSTGIANQISLLDVSDRRTITNVTEIDLSRSEDSVSSLAALATRDGLVALAGINSSTKDQKAGKNEHFRAFDVRYPPRKKQKTEKADKEVKAEITKIGQRSFFKPSSGGREQSYQRLLRLSQPKQNESANKRIGAIATGLAQDSEIIVFNATVVPPEEADIIARIDLPAKSEATDLDIIHTEDNEYSVAYCDDYNIYEQTFDYDFKTKKATKRPRGPRRVHQMPIPDTMSDMKSRPKFRCLRFLNDITVVALVNKAGKKGAELRMYHLYPTGPAMELWSRTLPSHIKQAASMDVCVLDADEGGSQQVVIAVAGQDISIEVFTTNFNGSTETFSALKPYLTMNNVHEQGMTQICFEPFHPPVRAPDPSEVKGSGKDGEPSVAEYNKLVSLHPGPQYIRLASVSYANTVVVDSFPLSPLDPKNKKSRYVLSHPSDESFWFWAYAIVIGAVVLVTAFLLQAVILGEDAPQDGLLSVLPSNIRNLLGQPAQSSPVILFTDEEEPVVAAVHSITSTSTSTSTSTITVAYADPSAAAAAAAAIDTPADLPNLRDLLAKHHGTPDGVERTAIIVSDVEDGDELKLDTHPDKAAYLQSDGQNAKHWHELEEKDRQTWKKKLIKAGQWAEHEGEAVLKGVLWSSYGGLVREAAGEILREL